MRNRQGAHLRIQEQVFNIPDLQGVPNPENYPLLWGFALNLRASSNNEIEVGYASGVVNGTKKNGRNLEPETLPMEKEGYQMF